MHTIASYYSIILIICNLFSPLGMEPQQFDKLVIFLRGTPAVGKTTISKLLAAQFRKSICIEQDLLRYMVVGGLVASRFGKHPTDFPLEYHKQCRLADKNIFSIVRNYTAEGYVCVVDGFNAGESSEIFLKLGNPGYNILWYPEAKILKKELENITYLQVILDSNSIELTRRLKERGFTGDTINFIMEEREIFHTTLKSGNFDLILNTNELNPSSIVKRIIDKIEELKN